MRLELSGTIGSRRMVRCENAYSLCEDQRRALSSEDEVSMKKRVFTPEEEMKLEVLRKSIDRYQQILYWQKIRRAEKKMLELRLRYDYRSYKRELMLDKYLVSLRPKKDRWWEDD